MSQEHLAGLVSLMQSANSSDMAESARLQLESRVLPNQVLRSEAARLAQLLLEGTSSASDAGQLETWELFAQLAAGSCGPTAADPEVLSQVRATMRGVLPVAIERVRSPVSGPYDDLVVDVLDSLMSIEERPEREAIAEALQQFGLRGTRERQRIDLVLRGPATQLDPDRPPNSPS